MVPGGWILMSLVIPWLFYSITSRLKYFLHLKHSSIFTLWILKTFMVPGGWTQHTAGQTSLLKRLQSHPWTLEDEFQCLWRFHDFILQHQQQVEIFMLPQTDLNIYWVDFKDIHNPQRMNPQVFGDFMTFSIAKPAGWSFYFTWNTS